MRLRLIRSRFLTACALSVFATMSDPSRAQEVTFPPTAAEVSKPMGYDTMRKFLDEVIEENDFIKVSSIGKTNKGRDIMMVRMNRGKVADPFKIMYMGSQHGDEHAGKDALIYLIHQIGDDPSLLPLDVDLTVIPMYNPDGVEADTRRNGNDKDLNRDHILLDEPETRALYAAFREVMPHVFVDCHEYGRDSEGYRAKGWIRWPTIMMGSVNNMLVDEPVRTLASKWVQDANGVFKGTDLTYEEYNVGGVPPENEQRFSTTGTDDARNGTGVYGTISFIIESAQYYSTGDRQTDLGRRVDAYNRLHWFLIRKTEDRAAAREAVKQARTKPAPDFIPTNYFWANLGNKTREVNVIDIATSATLKIKTNNFMPDLVAKRNVARPESYAIEPSAHQAVFVELLKRHAIPYETLAAPRTATVERCKLLRVEEEEDPIYARFDGRQIVEAEKAGSRTLPAGTVVVKTANGADGRRACLLLEPMMLFGLYEHDAYRASVDADGIVPVLRVLGN